MGKDDNNEEESNILVHNIYNKISDIVMPICKNYVLKFTVILSRKKKKPMGKIAYKDEDDSNFINYHKEYQYHSGSEERRSIARIFNYYLSIECVNKNMLFDDKAFIKISPTDIYIFKEKLNQVVQWFVSRRYAGMFAKKDGKIIIVNKQSSKIVVGANGYESMIEFEPAVFRSDLNEQFIGVNMLIDNDIAFIPVNNLLALNDMVQHFNMYLAAQNMVNYMGRPDYGTNISSF